MCLEKIPLLAGVSRAPKQKLPKDAPDFPACPPENSVRFGHYMSSISFALLEFRLGPKLGIRELKSEPTSRVPETAAETRETEVVLTNIN